MSNTISSANKIKELREIIKIQKELIDGLNREIGRASCRERV